MSTGRRLLLLSPAAALLLAALLPVSFSTPLPLCAVKALTGIDCPGCGMTRAFLLLAHGRVGEAMAMHPLAPLAFLVMAGMATAGIVRATREKDQDRSGTRIPLNPPLPKGEISKGKSFPPFERRSAEPDARRRT